MLHYQPIISFIWSCYKSSVERANYNSSHQLIFSIFFTSINQVPTILPGHPQFIFFLRTDIPAITPVRKKNDAFKVFRRPLLKCDGTRAETRFRLSAKRTTPFKSAGASVQSTTGSRGVRVSGSNAGYTMFRGSVKGTGYPFHSPVSPSLPLPCVTVCHHISTGVCLVGQAF